MQTLKWLKTSKTPPLKNKFFFGLNGRIVVVFSHSFMPREYATTRWCFTLNNWTEEEWRTLQANLRFRAKYAVVGKEVAPLTGTPHLQGFVILKTRERLAGVVQALGILRMHLEKTVATSTQAADYCKKDGEFLEIGSLPGTLQENGMSALLQKAKEDVDQGCTLEELWDRHFGVMVKYRSSLTTYLMLKQQKNRRPKPKTELLWGKTGTGKTRFVHDFSRIHYDDDLWIYSGGGWFDGYCGQRVALFDDYYGDIPFGLFLKVLDRYPVNVPVKGGFVAWKPERIFVTSNKHSTSWYDNQSDEMAAALIRRFDREYYLDKSIYE